MALARALLFKKLGARSYVTPIASRLLFARQAFSTGPPAVNGTKHPLRPRPNGEQQEHLDANAQQPRVNATTLNEPPTYKPSLRIKTSTPPPPLKEQQIRCAILVDSENAQRDAMDLIMQEVRDTLGGRATVRRVYGDFSSEQGASWKGFCLEHSFLPVHAFAYVQGKGSSDAALQLDTMELLYNNDIDGFCIVSSDSDFTRLAQKLREAGKYVVGFGHEQAVSNSFVAACEDFVFVNELVEREQNRIKQEQERQKVLAAKLQQEKQEQERLKALQKEKEEQERLEAEEAKRSFWERWKLYVTSFTTREDDGNDQAPANDGNKIASTDNNEEIAKERRESVPQHVLDTLHNAVQEYSAKSGFCRLQILSRVRIDHSSLGYETTHELLADFPEDFELVWAKSGRHWSVRSLKNPRPSINMCELHEEILKHADTSGWAPWGNVAKCVNIFDFGFAKITDLAERHPDEIETRMHGSTCMVKSLKHLTPSKGMLDALHAETVKRADESGWANWAVVAKSVDVSDFGVTKISELAELYPNEIGTWIDGSTMKVKSLKHSMPSKTKIERLHEEILKHADRSGWADWAVVARAVKVSDFGVTRISQLAELYPDEIGTWVDGSVLRIKSLRNLRQ